MIFDNDNITALVLEWQKTKDVLVMAKILDGSRALIEALVSYYDSIYRDDLIQEIYCKLQEPRVLNYYDPAIASLHNYLTTVIKNTCITYVEKQDREPDIDVDEIEMGGHDKTFYDDDILDDLLIRNRARFSSFPTYFVDDLTEYVYYALKNSGKSRRIVLEIERRFSCPKKVAYTFYTSTLVYMRRKFASNARVSEVCDELSLLPDLKEILGEPTYKLVAVTFSGLSFRLP